jgi:long-chain acyl-CoA synthetase
MSYAYNATTEEDIYEALNDKVKEVNKVMPAYKSIRGLTITEVPLIKTTTGKVKRQEEIKTI